MQQFGCKINVKVFPCCIFARMLFFSEHFNCCNNFNGTLKAGEIFSCMKFMCEKSKSMVLMKATSLPLNKIDCLICELFIRILESTSLEFMKLINVVNQQIITIISFK